MVHLAAMQAVDKNTLLQLRGATAKGYAFDRRYAQDAISDNIYEDCVGQLVENCFKVGCLNTAHSMVMHLSARSTALRS